MPRFNRSLQRSSGSRPNRAWNGFTSSTFTDLAASSKVIVAAFAAAAGDQTILRVVGQFGMTSDQSGAQEHQIGAFGMIRVSDAAFAIGVTAIPDPIADQDDDGWFVYKSFSQIGDGSVNSTSKTYEFDSKAKRIVELAGVTIVAVMSNASPSHAISFSMNFRILSQLRGTR